MITIWEWKSLPWTTRTEIKKKYNVRRSGNVVSSETLGVTRMEDDGVRESDLGPLKDKTLEELKVEFGLVKTDERKESQEGSKEAGEKVEEVIETPKKKRGRKPKYS